MQLQSRLTYILQFIAISSLLIFSLYLQFYQGILPCPLCTLQRIAFTFIGIFSLITAMTYSVRWCRLSLNFLSLIVSILGIILAARQTWLQHFPPASSGECSPNLQYMVQVLPMNELLQKIFSGSAECVDKTWQFLSLSMAEWAIICFALLSVLSLSLLWQDLAKPGLRRRIH